MSFPGRAALVGAVFSELIMDRHPRKPRKKDASSFYLCLFDVSYYIVGNDPYGFVPAAAAKGNQGQLRLP